MLTNKKPRDAGFFDTTLFFHPELCEGSFLLLYMQVHRAKDPSAAFCMLKTTLRMTKVYLLQFLLPFCKLTIFLYCKKYAAFILPSANRNTSVNFALLT